MSDELPPRGDPRATLRRMEEAVEASHRRRYPDTPRENPLNFRFQLALCDCGRLAGTAAQRLVNGQHYERCESCHARPRHPVEMKLTESSALLFAMRHLPAYAEAISR